MILLQTLPRTIPDTLNHDWAILVAIALLASVQIVKLILDYRNSKINKTQMHDLYAEMNVDRHRQEELMENLERYMQVIADGYNDNVSERQMPSCLNTSVDHLALRIGVDVVGIMLRNDIRSNPKTTDGKISAHVKNAFGDFRLHMALFKFNDVSLDKYIPTGYQDHILKYCVSTVLKSRASHKDGMDDLNAITSYLKTKFEKFESRMKENIYNNKCNE